MGSRSIGLMKMSKQLELNIEHFSIKDNITVPFRPIHYLGSKLRLVDQIREIAERVRPNANSFCDLFSGSSTLSYAMSKHYNVTAVDVQEYSRVLASGLMENVRPSIADANKFVDEIQNGMHLAELRELFSDAILYEKNALSNAAQGNPTGIVTILEDGSIKYGENPAVPHVFVTREKIAKVRWSDSPKIQISQVYGGIYFSYEQSIVIDAIRNDIEENADPAQRAILLAALVSTVSGCVNTIGKQFAQPIRLLAKDGRVKINLISKIIGDRSTDILTSYRQWLLKYCALPSYGNDCRALKGDYLEVLNAELKRGQRFDLIYADPPYTRDHYSRYYHLIETLCLRDAPSITSTTLRGKTSISRGMYREDRHQSPFCIKSKAPDAFSSLFASARNFNCPLLLSYSPFSRSNDDHPRLMDVEHIVELGTSYYSDASITYFDEFSHSKLNSTSNNKNRTQEAEVLITFLP